MSDLLQFGGVDRDSTAGGSREPPVETLTFTYDRITHTAGGNAVATEELVLAHQGFLKGEPVGLTTEGGELDSSAHPGGANFLMGDGSVRFISDSLDLI